MLERAVFVLDSACLASVQEAISRALANMSDCLEGKTERLLPLYEAGVNLDGIALTEICRGFLETLNKQQQAVTGRAPTAEEESTPTVEDFEGLQKKLDQCYSLIASMASSIKPPSGHLQQESRDLLERHGMI